MAPELKPTSKKEISFGYQDIQQEAESFARIYRLSHDVPALPNEDALSRYKNRLIQKFPEVVRLVREHTSIYNPDEGIEANGFAHLEWVSSLAGFIAEIECKLRQLPEDQTTQAIDAAILSGLLHDIERHRGFDENHMIEGAKVGEAVLQKAGVSIPEVVTVVRNHDHLDFEAEQNSVVEIAFGCVFDADHFRYGLEREDTFWAMKQKKGETPKEVIHDYQFLPPLLHAWRTVYGKKAGPKLIEFGLAVAKHIEDTFESQSGE